VFKYSGRNSLRGVISARTSRFAGFRCASPNSAICCGSASCSARVRLTVSSGRQMPTSEHPGHFGESTSGAGISPRSATAHACAISASVSATSASSNATRTRCPVLR
jgi:hypothetical protein